MSLNQLKLFIFLVANLLLLFSCTQQIQNQAEEKHSQSQKQKVAELTAQLGLNYLNQGDYVLAKQKLLIALQNNPDSLFANSVMAYYQERTGNIQIAEKFYLKALDLSDVKGAQENNYATFLCRQKRYKEAQKHFQLAMDDFKYLNTAKAYENAGVCAQSAEDNQQAVLFFEKAMQQDPNLKESMLHLAEIYDSQEEYAKAFDNIQTYLFLEKNPSTKSLSLAIELAEKMKDSKAIILYRAKLNNKKASS